MKFTKNRHSHLTVEPLEDRMLLTTATFANGVLRVYGTDYAERITIRQDSSRVTVDGVGYVEAWRVSSVVVQAYGGDDIVDCRSLRVGTTIYGGTGSDYIYGGAAIDRIFGQAGGDHIYGGDGDDKLFGGGAYDYLLGEGGNDFLDDCNRYGDEYLDGGAGYDFNADVWAVGSASYTDIVQQGSPTCSFLASLAAVAKTGVNFTNWIRYDGFTAAGAGQYTVWFRYGSGWTTQTVTFDGTVSWLDTATAVSQPGKVAEGETWVLLMQRAWKQMRGNDGRAWPHDAMPYLTGTNPTWYQTIGEDLKGWVRYAVNSGKAVVAATAGSPASPLIANHSYTVVAVWGTDDNFWVQVRNPWGVDGNGSAADGVNDGFIWLTWSTFKSSMANGLWVNW
jgi:Calpain family cysteine protease/RTX calcium-binding nonapeptide repeat (4 copies)